MEAKKKLFMTSIISLLASAVAITSATFAWIKYNRSITNMVTLSSGNSEATIEAFVYERRYNATTTPAEVAYYAGPSETLNVSQSSSSNGQVTVDFSSAFATDYALSTAVPGDVGAYALALPAYYLELRVIKPELYGYLTMGLQYVSIPTATTSELNFSTSYPFNFRYLAVDNVALSPMVSAIPSQISALESKTLASFFRTSGQRTSGISLFDLTDMQGSPVTNYTGLASQCFIPGFATQVNNENVFATSILLEISVDPALFQSFLRANPTILTYPLRFGIDFNVNIQFSNAPIYA